MKKCLIIIILFTILCNSIYAQKVPERRMEKLDRGIVAVRTNPGEVFVSWRLFGTDPDNTAFNLYRGKQKLNKNPLTQATWFIDKTASDNTYSVRAIIKGKEKSASVACEVWKQNYLKIPLNRPPGGTMEREVVSNRADRPDRPAGNQPQAAGTDRPQVDRRQYTYSPNDASIADLDGDGQYEIVLKWDPSNARDNAHDGYTANVIIDAYELDGTQLWRIDLGKNIRAGAHYTQFLVYDFDGDGKAEMACKTADGTIDGDGKDEIIYGSSAYDDDGKPLYTTGMGHGDAMHFSDLDPDRPGLEVWAVKETGGWGSVLHSARDGEILFSVPDNSDVGRGNAADIYPDHRGFELWSSATRGIYDVKGQKITNSVPSVNFRIYWDGDLQDELLDRTFIDDWDYINHKPVRLLDASEYGGASINGTKATPVISADILGDWREEVIFRGSDNVSLLLFTTTMPTDYRMKTLMHDPVYRLGIAWQNVVYNQPPHPGYYIGDGIPLMK